MDDEEELRRFEEQERKEWEGTRRRKPRRCPRCGSERVAYVIWGMPAFSTRLQELLETGEVEIAGCLLPSPPEAPATWVCRSCRHPWGLTDRERSAGLIPIGPEGQRG